MQPQPPHGPAGEEASGVELGIDGVVDAEEVGRGGFGVVYRCRQPQFNRTVAVKLLTVPVLDEHARRRFERELAAMGTLSGHPNIVPVFSAGFTANGHPYMVMEDMGGGSVADMMKRRGRLPWQEVAAIGTALADALDAAHRAGVLHRDVKPENVLISKYGTYKLGDFGIARLDTGGETRTNTLQLSILHAPPEVLDGAEPTVAADVYSLGSTLYTLLAGLPPFARLGEASVYPAVARIHNDPVPSLRSVGVPDPLCRAIEHALEKQPERRPQSAAAFGEEIRAAAKDAELPSQMLPVALDAERTISIDELPPGALARPLSAPVTGPPGPRSTGPPPVSQPYQSQGPVQWQPPPGWSSQSGPPRRGTTVSPLVWVIGAVVLLALAGGGIALATRGSGPSTPTATASHHATQAPPSATGNAQALDQATLNDTMLTDADVLTGFTAATPSVPGSIALCARSIPMDGRSALASKEWDDTTTGGIITEDEASFATGGAHNVLALETATVNSCNGSWQQTLSGSTVDLTASPCSSNVTADETQCWHLTYATTDGTQTADEYLDQARVGDVLIWIRYYQSGAQASLTSLDTMLSQAVDNVTAAEGR